MPVFPADVKAIYSTEKTDAEVQVFIDIASLVTSEDLASSDLSSARIDLITTYLAAHFLALSDTGPGSPGQLKRQRVGDADESYDVPVGEFGYLSTRFGQQALALDSSGLLAASQANKGIRATFEVVGTVPALSTAIKDYYGPEGV